MELPGCLTKTQGSRDLFLDVLVQLTVQAIRQQILYHHYNLSVSCVVFGFNKRLSKSLSVCLTIILRELPAA